MVTRKSFVYLFNLIDDEYTRELIANKKCKHFIFYRRRFGLYEVDYESPQRTRTPRKSAFVFKEILRSRSLDPNYEPTTTTITIDPGH